MQKGTRNDSHTHYFKGELFASAPPSMGDGSPKIVWHVWEEMLYIWKSYWFPGKCDKLLDTIGWTSGCWELSSGLISSQKSSIWGPCLSRSPAVTVASEERALVQVLQQSSRDAWERRWEMTAAGYPGRWDFFKAAWVMPQRRGSIWKAVPWLPRKSYRTLG